MVPGAAHEVPVAAPVASHEVPVAAHEVPVAVHATAHTRTIFQNNDDHIQRFRSP